jgi:hypothetical protein
VPSMERRRMPRCALRVDSWVSMEKGRQYGGLVTDLSRSGCRVHSFIPLIDGMPLQLQLRLPGDVAPLRIGRAVVRWTHKAFFGVEFLAIDPNEEQRLHRVMANLLASPA